MKNYITKKRNLFAFLNFKTLLICFFLISIIISSSHFKIFNFKIYAGSMWSVHCKKLALEQGWIKKVPYEGEIEPFLEYVECKVREPTENEKGEFIKYCNSFKKDEYKKECKKQCQGYIKGTAEPSCVKNYEEVKIEEIGNSWVAFDKSNPPSPKRTTKKVLALKESTSLSTINLSFITKNVFFAISNFLAKIL